MIPAAFSARRRAPSVRGLAAPFVAAAMLVAASCAAAGPPSPARATGTSFAGYLNPADLPDSLALLPPPPAANSADLAADEAGFAATRALTDTPRWRQASQDADLISPAAPGNIFSCALGVQLTDQTTPSTLRLLRHMLLDAGGAANRAKDAYKRARPFTEHPGAPICVTPSAALAANGSYPSGHASIGWAWALALAEIAPQRRNETLMRGYAFGESRFVCGVHWKSDVSAGRTIGAATIAALHGDQRFQTDLAAARREIAAAGVKAAPPEGRCAAEAAALAQKY